MWAYELWVQKWGMLVWNKRLYRCLSNAIVALQPLKRNFAEFCGLFSYQALLRFLILCLCNKQLMFFRNMFLKGPLGFFFNSESFFFNAENSLLLLLRIQRYMRWITTPHVGILRTMRGLQSKNFGETKRTRKKEHTSYLFISCWQSALAKYALEFGHHIICEQSRCCVQ